MATNGIAAVTIIQFGTIAETEVDHFVVASPVTAAVLCDEVSAIVKNGGSTHLVPPLDIALDLFKNDAEGNDRLVVILSDGGVFDRAEALDKCELLRTRRPTSIVTAASMAPTWD